MFYNYRLEVKHIGAIFMLSLLTFLRQKLRRKVIDLLSPERSVEEIANCNVLVMDDVRHAAAAAQDLEKGVRAQETTRHAKVIVVRSLGVALHGYHGYVCDEADIIGDDRRGYEWSPRIKEIADIFEMDLIGYVGPNNVFRRLAYRRYRPIEKDQD